MGVPFLGDCTDLFLRSGWTALQTCTHAQRLPCEEEVGGRVGRDEGRWQDVAWRSFHRNIPIIVIRPDRALFFPRAVPQLNV